MQIVVIPVPDAFAIFSTLHSFGMLTSHTVEVPAFIIDAIRLCQVELSNVCLFAVGMNCRFTSSCFCRMSPHKTAVVVPKIAII